MSTSNIPSNNIVPLIENNQTTSGDTKSRDTNIDINSILTSLHGMEAVESTIRSKFDSKAEVLTLIPEYLLKLGGKRIRPSLCLIVAELCGLKLSNPNSEEPLIQVAAGIELIHMATLLHDDIIDRSPIRRGKKAPHLEFGESATLLSGDFLLVRAFALCAKLDQFIIDETEEACVRLTEGEVLELPLTIKNFTREESLDIAEKKTAALFGLAAICGAHLAGVNLKTKQALKNFGLSLGIAFQILDDVLDVVADEKILGKKCGGDLVEKKPSLVNILWLESEEQLAKEILLTSNTVNEDTITKGLEQLKSSNSKIISEARSIANQYIEEARRSLDIAVQNIDKYNQEAFQKLSLLIDYTVERLK